jgi:predicted nucleic acid-binding protein
MITRLRLNQIETLSNVRIFLDANIWLYIFCPLGNHKPQTINKYSAAFKKLLLLNNQLLTDVVVLSEVVNRWISFGFEQYKQHPGHENLKRKQYRNSQDYIELTENIFKILSEQLKRFEVANCLYSSGDLSSLLCNMGTTTDFNDEHILSTCRTHNSYLLTDDGDFVNCDIQVISGNPVFVSGD